MGTTNLIPIGFKGIIKAAKSVHLLMGGPFSVSLSCYYWSRMKEEEGKKWDAQSGHKGTEEHNLVSIRAMKDIFAHYVIDITTAVTYEGQLQQVKHTTIMPYQLSLYSISFQGDNSMCLLRLYPLSSKSV
ncbi:hypothetical protein LOAG_02627 [Loa loa]|uniref:Uncharacterized protein n=1 Tax=Loa loa TaxID=7209 RepID=A0A1S0U678_LOALO|nr:hypothetical protein LOAG_02627 [Loa loa]EFO25857.1 hypothetical protein LOAG_02627 [Loa loa]